jgi:hypothetical protein
MSLVSRARAAALFFAFRGRAPTKDEIITVRMPKDVTALEVGEFYGVMYKVPGTAEPYLHKFNGRRRPKLYVSADGSQLIAIGGDYKFTDRGFIG